MLRTEQNFNQKKKSGSANWAIEIQKHLPPHQSNATKPPVCGTSKAAGECGEDTGLLCPAVTGPRGQAWSITQSHYKPQPYLITAALEAFAELRFFSSCLSVAVPFAEPSHWGARQTSSIAPLYPETLCCHRALTSPSNPRGRKVTLQQYYSPFKKLEGIYFVYNTLKSLETKSINNRAPIFIFSIIRRTEIISFKGDSPHLYKGYFFQTLALQVPLLIYLLPYLQNMKV